LQAFSDAFQHIEIVRKFLFVMPGSEWKEARNAVTPAFSSGKIKKV
jgi:cytochrome P450